MPTTFNPFMPFHPKADSQVILSRECFERGCAAHNHMTDGPGVVFEDWEAIAADQAMTIAILKSELNLVYEVAAQICEKYAKANEENDNMVAAFIQAADELRTKKDFPVLIKLLRGE
jgi:hypothetical protein